MGITPGGKCEKSGKSYIFKDSSYLKSILQRKIQHFSITFPALRVINDDKLHRRCPSSPFSLITHEKILVSWDMVKDLRTKRLVHICTPILSFRKEITVADNHD